jgi:hypothetical protein
MHGPNKLIFRENGMGQILETIDFLVVALILINLQKGHC